MNNEQENPGTALIPLKDVAPHHIPQTAIKTLVSYQEVDGIVTKTYTDGSTVTTYPSASTETGSAATGKKPYSWQSWKPARELVEEPVVPRYDDMSFAGLRDILMYRRQGRTRTEKRFIRDIIAPLNCKVDGYGNYYKRIGNAPVMWACHTDSVHRDGGFQAMSYGQQTGILSLATKEKTSNCLGADDGAGIWVMVEMIKAGVEGLYVFHRDEESGGGGSQHFAKHHAEDYKHVNMCISLDRYGYNSVITHQWGRCCSDDYGDALSEALNGQHKLFDFKRDSGGLFTDSANYTDDIPECTNLSVGYFGHHTSSEEVSVPHLLRLKDALSNIDTSKLPVVRKVTDGGYGDYADWSKTYKGTGYYGANSKKDDKWWDRDHDQLPRGASSTPLYLDERDDYAPSELDDIIDKSVQGGWELMVDLIENNPYEVCDLLEHHGYDAQGLCLELRKRGVVL